MRYLNERAGYVCALIGICLMSYGIMVGSEVSYSQVQKNNEHCLCCTCKGFTRRHPPSIEEAQIAIALLSLPLVTIHGNNNNNQVSMQQYPLLQIVLDYYYADDWLAMRPITGVLEIIMYADNNANRMVPYVAVRTFVPAPMSEYSVLDLNLVTAYKKMPLINKHVQFIDDDIKKLQSTVRNAKARQYQSDEVTSVCGHFKVSVCSDRANAVCIQRETYGYCKERIQELWCKPGLLAILLHNKPKKRCVIS